jgi:hypothetical protein
MASELKEILEHPPVQVTCEAFDKDSQWKMYVRMYAASDEKGRFDIETRRIEDGEPIAHVAFIFLPSKTYQVDLIAKTYKVMGSDIGFDFDSMGLKLVEVIQEEPDPHLFLITADLRPE